MLRDVLASHMGGETFLAIGPEGGWAEDELSYLDAGWTSASLGYDDPAGRDRCHRRGRDHDFRTGL